MQTQLNLLLLWLILKLDTFSLVRVFTNNKKISVFSNTLQYFSFHAHSALSLFVYTATEISISAKRFFFFFLLDVCRSIHLHTNSKIITVEIQSLDCNNDTKKQQELSSSCIVSKSPGHEFMNLELSSCFGNTMLPNFFFLYVLFSFFFFPLLIYI